MRLSFQTIVRYLQGHPLQASVIIGFLLGIGLLYPVTPVLTVLGISLSVWLASTLNDARGLFFAGTISWTVKSLLSVSFMWSMYPIYWLEGVSNVAQLAMIGLNWLLVGFSLGVVGGLVWLLIHWFCFNLTQTWLRVITVAGLWSGGEILGSLLFSLVFLGPGSTIGLSFSYGFVGYALAALPVFQIGAVVFGVYSLSFLAVVLAQMIMRIHRVRWWFVIIPITKIVIVSFVLHIYFNYNEQGVSIATIDTFTRDRTVPTALTDSTPLYINQIHEAVMASVSHNLDFVLLPEDARYFSNFDKLAKTNDIALDRITLRTFPGTIIDSGRTAIDTTTAVLRAQYFQNGQPVMVFDKKYLTPQGEFLSYWQSSLLRAFGFKDVLEEYFWSSYVPGQTTQLSTLGLPAVLFCFEASHPLAVRMRVTNNTPFVVYPISHAWFYNADTLTHQTDMMMRTHAIWNRLPIVSAANMEAGKVYYPDGRIVVPVVTDSGDGWVVRVINL